MSGQNGRYVTPPSDGLHHHSEHYWCGRLAMAVAVAQKAPETAKQALHEYVQSPVASDEVRRMIHEELKRK